MKKCPYCAEKIPNDSVVCKYCCEDLGSVIENEIEKIDALTPVAKIKSDSNSIPNLIKNHLEFLGYQCEAEEGEDYDLLTCKHESKSNIVISCRKNATLSYLRAGYRLSGDSKIIANKSYYETYNEINKETSITKWYSTINEDGDVVVKIESNFNGYEKASFGVFVEAFEEEISTYINRFTKFTT